MTDVGESFERWLLLEGSRHVVAAALAAVVFLVLVALGYGGVVDLVNDDGIRTAAGGTIPGLFTFLSIVLAINQLVLSQEFGSADELRERLGEIREFRHDVEDHAGQSPSPVVPTGFLAVVVRTIGETAASLEATGSPDDETDADEAVAAFAVAVQDDVDEALATLDRVGSGRVNAVLSVLEYRETRQLYEARRLQAAFGDELGEGSRELLDRLIDVLNLFSVARTHFRTTYTQRVLARLSRLLLYVGVPALLAAIVLALAGVPQAVPAAFRAAVVSAFLTLALAPLAVLFAYILRIAAVSERTIAVGPFVSQPGSVEPADQWGRRREGKRERDGPADADRTPVEDDDPPGVDTEFDPSRR